MKLARTSKPLEMRLQDDYSGMSPAQIAAVEQEFRNFARCAAQRLGPIGAWQLVKPDQPFRTSETRTDRRAS
jgi:hypothetical protein